MLAPETDQTKFVGLAVVDYSPILVDDDDDEADGPMPALEDEAVALVRKAYEDAKKTKALARAVAKQKRDALEAAARREARAAEEALKAHADEEAASEAAAELGAALLEAEARAKAQAQAIDAVPEPEPLSSPRTVVLDVARLPDVAWSGGVEAVMGGHNKAAGEILSTRQEQPAAEPVGADADGVEDVADGGGDVDVKDRVDDAAQGLEAAAEAAGADAKEGGGEPLNANGVEEASSQELGGAEAMAEKGEDDTVSCVEAGVADVDDVVAGATGAVEEGVGDGTADVAYALAIVPVTAGPLAATTGILGQFLAVGYLVEAHYGNGLVRGKTVVRKALEPWSTGSVVAVHRVSSSRVQYDIRYDTCGTRETGVPASCVRRCSADGRPEHIAHGHSAH